MNIGFVACIILAVLFLVLGIIFALLKEKGAYFVSGFRTLNHSEKYDKAYFLLKSKLLYISYCHFYNDEAPLKVPSYSFLQSQVLIQVYQIDESTIAMTAYPLETINIVHTDMLFKDISSDFFL